MLKLLLLLGLLGRMFVAYELERVVLMKHGHGESLVGLVVGVLVGIWILRQFWFGFHD